MCVYQCVEDGAYMCVSLHVISCFSSIDAYFFFTDLVYRGSKEKHLKKDDSWQLKQVAIIDPCEILIYILVGFTKFNTLTDKTIVKGHL